eukprot:Opistho-1_new@79734
MHRRSTTPASRLQRRPSMRTCRQSTTLGAWYRRLCRPQRLSISTMSRTELSSSPRLPPTASGRIRWTLTTWSSVGTVSNSAALALESDDRLRFEPNADFQGTATFTFRLWDKSDGKSGGATIDASTNGGTSSIGSESATATITVTNVNDRPILAALAYTLTTIAEDVAGASNVGDTVATILGAGVTDIDPGAVEGLAISSAVTTNGKWQFKLAGGSWTDVPSVSATNVLMLAADSSIRFMPNADYFGSASAAILAWDVTDGTAGNTMDPTGDTAF